LWFGGLFKEPKPWDFPYTKLADLPADAPIVIADPLMFLEANYYEPPEVAARLRFITNREAALRITGTDVFDRGYYTMRRWFPIKGKVVEYSLFRQTEKHYYVFGSFDNPEDWFIRTLLRDGVPVLARGQYRYAASHGDESVLLEVCQGTKLTGSTACE
jgi:hypothetical protein